MIIDNTHSKRYTLNRPSSLFTSEVIDEHFEGEEANYYVAHARWIASRYNLSDSGSYSHQESKGPHQRRAEDTTVAQIYQNFAYVLGEQENFTYAYLTQDEEGGNLSAPFTKGEQIYRLVEFMKNTLRSLLSKARISVESLDPSKQSKKMSRLQDIELKEKLIDLFEGLENETGMGFYPEGVEQGDMETAKEELEMAPADELEEGGMDLLTDAINRNRLHDIALRAAVNCIVGRHACIWPEVENGRLVAKAIPPYMLITDDSEDDDFRKNDEYRGFMEFLSEAEVNARWVLDADEKEMLKNAQGNSGYLNHYNNPREGRFSFKWMGSGEEQKIACATVWWVSEVPAEKGREKGRVKKKGSDQYERGTDYAEFVLERATLIGNCIIKDYGNDTNVVYSPHDEAWPLFPPQVYTPNMYLGTSRSIVDRFKKTQDDIDAYDWKIREKLAKDLGKVYIVNGHKVGEGDTGRSIIDNLKRIGLHVTEGTDGEDFTALDNKSMLEVVDMTNSSDIHNYVALIEKKEKDMEEIINASEVSMGQVSRYIGHGSQQASINANMAGMGSYIDGFLEFYTYNLQYMLNKLKAMLADTEGAERAEVVLSESKIKFFKNSTEFQIEDHMVKVTIEDIIDDQAKERLRVYAQAMVQNVEHSGIDWEDILDLETARTYTELRRRLRRKVRRSKRESEKKEAMMLQAQMEQSRAADAKSMQQQLISEEGKNTRERESNEMKMAGKVLDRMPADQEAPPNPA